MLKLKKTNGKSYKSCNKNEEILLLNTLDKCTRNHQSLEIIREDKLILRNRIKSEDTQVIKIIRKYRKPLNLHQMQVELRKHVTYIRNKIKLQQLNRFKQNLNTYQCTCYPKKQKELLEHQVRQALRQQNIYKNVCQFSKYKQSIYNNQIIEERDSFQEQTQKSSTRLRVSPVSERRFYVKEKPIKDSQEQEKGTFENQIQFKDQKSYQQNKQILAIKMNKEQQEFLSSSQTFKQLKQPQLKRSDNFEEYEEEEMLRDQYEQQENYDLNNQDYNNFIKFQEVEVHDKFNKNNNRNSIRQFKKNVIFQQKFVQIEPKEQSNSYNIKIQNNPKININYQIPQCTLNSPLINPQTIHLEQLIKPQQIKQLKTSMKLSSQIPIYNTFLTFKDYNYNNSKTYDMNLDNYKYFQPSYQGYTDPQLLDQCRKIIQKKKIQSLSPKNNFTYKYSPIIQYNYNIACPQHQQPYQISYNQNNYKVQENKYSPINTYKQMSQIQPIKLFDLKYQQECHDEYELNDLDKINIGKIDSSMGKHSSIRNSNCQNIIYKQSIKKRDGQRVQVSNFVEVQCLQNNSNNRQQIINNQKEIVFPSPFENKNQKYSRFQFSYQNEYNMESKRMTTEECQQQRIFQEIDIFREKYAEDIFDVFFQDKSEIFLSKEHFISILAQILEAQEIQFEEESILQLFYLIDKVHFLYQKKDGQIDPFQLGQALEILAMPKDNQLKFIFKLIDQQNKGKIYKKQFKQFIEQIIQDNQQLKNQINIIIQNLYEKVDFTKEGAIYYWYMFFLKNNEEVEQLLQFLNQYQFEFQ